MTTKLCGKMVKPVCYKSIFGEVVEYELIGARGAIWHVIRHKNSLDTYFIRNGNGKITALEGNYTLTTKNGYLSCRS